MELTDKTEQELLQELVGLKRQLLELSLKKCSGALPKSHMISDLKKHLKAKTVRPNGSFPSPTIKIKTT